MLDGNGKKHAHDILRVMLRSATVDGLTRGEVSGQILEGLQGDRRKAARSRFGEAWACLDRSGALNKGSGGGQRWVLANHFEHLLRVANTRT